MLTLQDADQKALAEIAVIMRDSDVSPFEVIHSGLVAKLVAYLTHSEITLRDARLRRFLHVFLGCPVSKNLTDLALGFCITTYKAGHVPVSHIENIGEIWCVFL